MLDVGCKNSSIRLKVEGGKNPITSMQLQSQILTIKMHTLTTTFEHQISVVLDDKNRRENIERKCKVICFP